MANCSHATQPRDGAPLATVMLGACVLALATVLLVFSAGEARGAANLPAGFTQTRLAAGLNAPTAMAMAPDGRVLVALQGGRLRVIEKGRVLDAPAVDLSGRIDANGERGLLGIALDPGFGFNRYVYLYHTRKATDGAPAFNQVSRFTMVGDKLAPSSEKVILKLDPLGTATNHNGGAIHFGKDGKLYVAVGENGTAENAQSLDNRLGKMLRINKNGTIPTDNPFYDDPRVAGDDRSIWALGLRNPYTFGVQPGSGRIFINDVGAKAFEEINAGFPGANYGWPVHEGRESDPMYTPPVFAYGHGSSVTTGCAITGGAFYNPSTRDFPTGYVGDYFFADFCSGWVRRYDSGTKKSMLFATGLDRPVDLMVGNGGGLFYLEKGTGSVYRVMYGAG